MIVAAAVCPPPPALVPQVGLGLPEMEPVRRAAAAAVASLVAAAPERIVVIGPRATAVDADEAAGGTFKGFGVDVTAGGSDLQLPPAYSVGAWLLDHAGWSGRRCYTSARFMVGAADALLVMADSDTAVGVSAPTHGDPRAAKCDDIVAAALAAGDAQALADLDVELAEQEWAASGVAPLRLFGDMTKGARITAHLRSDEAPFGVRYWVADWQLTWQ